MNSGERIESISAFSEMPPIIYVLKSSLLLTEIRSTFDPLLSVRIVLEILFLFFTEMGPPLARLLLISSGSWNLLESFLCRDLGLSPAATISFLVPKTISEVDF